MCSAWQFLPLLLYVSSETTFRAAMKLRGRLRVLLHAIVLFHFYGLTACTAPHFDSRITQREGSPIPPLVRLHDVAFPLLMAAAEWCGVEQEPTYGFLVGESRLPESNTGATGDRFVSVVYVHPRLPAAGAGLKSGDHVIYVNTQNVVGMSAEELSQFVRRLTIARIQPLQLEVERHTVRHTIYLWSVPACRLSVELIENEDINAITDGRRIGVTTGAMQFVRSDEELAWMLSHEIGHNVLSHVQTARLRVLLDRFRRATIDHSGTITPSITQRLMEEQADYVGLYILAKAGYDLRAIGEVWRRVDESQAMQKVSPASAMLTHPSSAERMAAFEQTRREIEEKRARGEPLKPIVGEGP